MNTSLRSVLAFLPVMLLAACGGSDDDLDDRLNLADPKVRLVHAVPLAPSVSLFRDDVAQAAEVTDVAYKSASRYFDVDTNSARWDVRTATTPSVSVGSVEFEAERGDKYTLIAVPDAGSLTGLVRIRDPYSKSVTSDNARLRVFNASFNADGLDVYLTAPSADLATATPTFSAVGYKQAEPASGKDSIETEGGNYRLRFTTAGTKNVIFDAEVNLGRDADWLLVTVPRDADDIGVLVIKSDEGAPATELASQ
jgi:hypothetical protein